ncbi:sodium bile acid cotransporter 7, partial [Nannochloropsis gaditana]
MVLRSFSLSLVLLLPLLFHVRHCPHATTVASMHTPTSDASAFSGPPFLPRQRLVNIRSITKARGAHVAPAYRVVSASLSPVHASHLPNCRGGGEATGFRLRPALRRLTSSIIRKHFLVTGMVIAIVLARYNPHFGRIGGPLAPEWTVNTVGVSVIFLLSGLSLQLQELTSAAKDFKLNAAIQAFNLGAGPLLGLAFQPLLIFAGVDARLATGLLIVSCLPTTVNMCIVLSGAAGASLALAVFNAVLSNFLGVFVAPATIFACVGAQTINVPYVAVIKKLVYKVGREERREGEKRGRE